MQPSKHRTWAEIDLGAIEHNYRVICAHAKAPVLCVVKADAYGHGAVPVAKRLQAMGAPYFAAATVPEAVELRENGITKPILILGYVDAADMDDIARYHITAPESLAGIGGTIAGEDSASVTLQYDGLSLDDAMPQRTGLTPADAMFCLLDDLRKGEPVQIWSETASGTELVALKYAYDSEDGKIEKQVWLTEQGYQLACAELYADGERVLQIQVASYRET